LVVNSAELAAIATFLEPTNKPVRRCYYAIGFHRIPPILYISEYLIINAYLQTLHDLKARPNQRL
jgi:hypothetical protein